MKVIVIFNHVYFMIETDDVTHQLMAVLRRGKLQQIRAQLLQ